MLSSSFLPTGYGAMGAALRTSLAQALPGGGGSTLIVTNWGPSPIVVLLGTSSAVSVTVSSGMMVMPHDSVSFVVGQNAYIAAMATEGPATLNLAQGTFVTPGSGPDPAGLQHRTDYDASTPPNMIYEGWGLPGTASSAATWSIKKYTYSSGSDVLDQYAGNAAFVSVWDNRASLVYA